MQNNALRFHSAQEKTVSRIRKGNRPVKVVFLVVDSAVWKCDTIYKLMETDGRYEPMILVCPIVNYDRENMLRFLRKTYTYFSGMGYKTYCSYDEHTDSYMDVRADLNADVLFYTNPYKGLIDDRYYLDKYPELLSCYIPYCFSESKGNYEATAGTFFTNALWRRYTENGFSSRLLMSYSAVGGENVRIVGYAGADSLIRNEPASDPWKIKDRKIKRFVWAPHHTIDGYVYIEYSTFLTFAEFMLELAEKYRDSIQIAFKPHPLLKNRLNMAWGPQKTEAYYSQWERLSNGMLCDNEYVDLFLTSDAIIHDSGSFIAEYLFTEKPAMHLVKNKKTYQQYNKIGLECLKHYYKGRCENDIEEFVKMVIAGEDPLKKTREKFVREHLLPPGGLSASQNIMNDLTSALFE